MKATKGLNNENKPGYFFTDITNINNFDPNLVIINETAVFNSGSTMYEISYNKECNISYIVFNNRPCIFRKSGQMKMKHKNMK